MYTCVRIDFRDDYFMYDIYLGSERVCTVDFREDGGDGLQGVVERVLHITE